MISTRLLADIGRLCSLDLPAPAVAAALAPIVREVIGCELATFSRLAPDGTFANVGMSDRPPPREVLDICTDPVLCSQIERTGSDDFWTLVRSGRKFQSTTGIIKQFARSSLYELLFVPQEVHHGVRMPLFSGSQPIGFVMVARAPGGREFSMRETERLMALGPWLGHALDTDADRLAGDWQVDEGVAILDAAGGVRYKCPDAKRLLAMLAQRRGRNEPSDSVWLEHLLRRLADDCVAMHTGRHPSRAPSWQGGTPWGWLSLRAAPLDLETAGTPDLIALRIARRIPRPLALAQALAGNGRLTNRQKDICLALAEGLSRNEIATRLGLRTSTVITHIRDLYARLGAEDREDMLRIVLKDTVRS